MRTIERLAIVNRGEPVARVLAAVAESNEVGDTPPITTIVLYTDPDAGASFVRAADEAVPLGSATYVDPVDGHRVSRFLDEPAILETLCRVGADAVWVGWGFLAESASFAQRCEEAGIIFVGPASTTIRLLGDKIEAKLAAERAQVPVVPWSGDAVKDLAGAVACARRLGYPVMVKAAAGGGGRGIRLIRDEADLEGALESARDEAEAAFGNPTVFVEKVVAAARHVEVQIIGDEFGTVWAVGVRDCTIQRRHQKVIEESSSPGLSPGTEAEISAAAVRLATATGYRSAGTVEFLVDPATGEFRFLEVNTRLQVEHPVTEVTTGLDLVKLQLHVARGGRLDGAPPPARGHAVEARLCAEDPANQFAPAPGRVAVFSVPAGPGIRVDAGVRAGDSVVPHYDSMIAKIIAWGADRAEAIARLRRALAQTTVVIDGGTTNLSFLLAVLGRPEVRQGRVDNQWLDRLTAAGDHLPAADPVAVLQAAVELYEVDEAGDREAFHARAARGRPVTGEVGHRCRVGYRGRTHALRVFRTGPDTYRVDVGGTSADLAVRWIDRYERLIEVGGRRHHIVSTVDGSSLRVVVDGVAHLVSRDDGGVVRSGFPALVVSVRVHPGDRVTAGDPLMVLESMKMETTVTAPFDGEVVSVDVRPHRQVDSGTPLARIRPGATQVGQDALLDLRDVATAEPGGTDPADRVYAALSGYLLGYDLDPQAVADLVAEQRRLGRTTPPADPGLLRGEDALLELFTDVAWLYRPRTETGSDKASAGTGTQEHLLAYLQWLDPVRAGLPDDYRERLERALRRYGLTDLRRCPALEAAVVWMFRSLSRAAEFVPVVTTILERRLRDRRALMHLADPALRSRLDQLAAAAEGRYQVVADLARDVRFWFLDEPALSVVVDAESVLVDGHLDALSAATPPADAGARLNRLIASPQPMRDRLLRRWLSAPTDHLQRTLLEVYARRYYRIRDLRDLTCTHSQGRLIGTVHYDLDGRRVQLVVAYTPLADLPSLSQAIRAHLDAVPADPAGDRDPDVVVDVTAWHGPEIPDPDALVADLHTMVSRHCDFGRRLHRLDLTVTGPPTAGHQAARHVTFRQAADGTFAEERLYRNLHPMLAKRLDLWRLSNFELERLPSPEDIYLFLGVARDNPADRRLFALAEVRDLTPAPDGIDGRGGAAQPRLELLGRRALSAIRQALAGFAPADRPIADRIVVYVRPLWLVPEQTCSALARSLAPLASGIGLEKVVLRVRLPGATGEPRDAVLRLEGFDGHELKLREAPVGQAPVRTLTPYRQRVLRARRAGAPYPYEIVRLLAVTGGSRRFGPGRWVEHDLDASGGLAPVDRPPGHNTANVVVGLITNETAKVPEGMTRVALLGDPTRGLGNVAEAECRRIIAALDLAERLRVPVEWFALSSGARIAMDSGTENMDWIAAVLRRLIEFTQAGGEVNIVITGINVGAQPYWNAEATMLMHTRGILVMTPHSAMVLTGKQALDFSGGVSAEDNLGIGGFDRIMGPNGQGQYWARNLGDACDILLAHYAHTYVVPGEEHPRRAVTADPNDRDVRTAAHPPISDDGPTTVGHVFSAERNGDRKRPFDIRAVMRAVSDVDLQPLERWRHWHGAGTVVVWDAHLGGIPVCLLGVESRTLPRSGFVPADGPSAWNSGTLFPQASRKLARAVNAASGNRPVVMLANLSGFDGSPESMRRWQLEYGAEIGRAITNFRGPIVFVVIARYHGGAFVVFSKRLNERLEIAAVRGSYASVIGGAPAAATVFARDVDSRIGRDPRILALREEMDAAAPSAIGGLRTRLAETTARVRSEKLGEVADEFDRVHDIGRALTVGSVDRIIAAQDLRPYLIDAVERGLSASIR